MQLIERPSQRDWTTRIPIPEEFKDKRENTHLKLHVEYVMGGQNFFSDSMNARGYRISWRRVQCGNNFESFMLTGGEPMDNGYVMLESAPRYQAKRLKVWAENVDPQLDELAKAILARDKALVLTIAHARLGAEGHAPQPPAPPPPVKELLTEKLRNLLIHTGIDSQLAVCKFFNPAGGGTWIVSGMDSDGDTLWCLVDLGMDCCEQGTVSLKELQETKLPMGLHIERDLHFEPRGRTLQDFYKIYEEKGTLTGVS